MDYIYKVVLHLEYSTAWKKYYFKIYEYKIEKHTKKSIIFYESLRKKVLTINDLNIINNLFDEEKSDIISYYVYTVKDSINNIKDRLIIKVIDEIKRRKNILDIFMKFVESKPPEYLDEYQDLRNFKISPKIRA